MNTFGHKFRFTTFGESHGKALGCIVDGVPAGLKVNESFIQNEMNRRKPGQNEFATARNEGDKVEILSGVFEGVTTGTSIAMVIFNENQKKVVTIPILKIYFAQDMQILPTLINTEFVIIKAVEEAVQERQLHVLQQVLLQNFF